MTLLCPTPPHLSGLLTAVQAYLLLRSQLQRFKSVQRTHHRKEEWGKSRDEERLETLRSEGERLFHFGTFCISSKGPESHRGSKAHSGVKRSLKASEARGTRVRGLMSTGHLQTMRNALTTASVKKTLNHCRMTSSAHPQIKPHRQVQSVVSFVKLWKLPSIFGGKNNSVQLVSISVLLLEHKLVTRQLGHHS